MLMKLKAKYRYHLALRTEGEISTLAFPFIYIVVAPLTQQARAKMTSESKVSDDLFKLLGYVAGIVSTISKGLPGQNLKRALATDIAFSKILLVLFNASPFIRNLNSILVNYGYHADLSPKETVIGYLQNDQLFSAAMICGANDYRRQDGKNYFPTCLFELGLMSIGAENCIQRNTAKEILKL